MENAQECLLHTNATVAQLVIGDNGAVNGNYLRLNNGADLTAGISAGGTVNWTGIGYNRKAQVDVETGAKIIQNIRLMAKNRTTIIVSHRLSALRHADTIISIVDGQISERGSHPELMNNNGYYARTFRLQEIEEEFNAH